MDSVNEETKAAIKLTRADAVKLVATEMIEQCADDVSKAEQCVIACRDSFRAWACAVALQHHSDAVMSAMDAVGAEYETVHSTCTYRVYANGTDSGDTVQVIFSDHPQTFEARMRLALSIGLSADGVAHRASWLSALTDMVAAKARDLRVGSMKKEAREILIKSVLDSSDEGLALVNAVRALAARMNEQR